MDLTQVVPGAIYNTGQVFIAEPLAEWPIGYQSCRVRFEQGWCYIELNEADGEGSVHVYPTSQILAVINLYPPVTGPPDPDKAVPAGQHQIERTGHVTAPQQAGPPWAQGGREPSENPRHSSTLPDSGSSV
ncbi:hypothetical protein E4P40_13195 [Blastococcus sp. CT_GayMR20]|uniref:hypothetical protein n=1 Tax=Blastococcus sp. CT_GayMR20 TaxID=2559609 RepID=UPI001073C84A|nr:hypothetical protein [Blastococcus sp. CT_GayMR20]TFV86204.1 hypothetical protein E4P40_13080 [Blastococcus sp. CT_GayMR20]TFV86223.1 hypothetical protein E4P40_13195 [Blastococcus sp. CT_GayMR20]